MWYTQSGNHSENNLAKFGYIFGYIFRYESRKEKTEKNTHWNLLLKSGHLDFFFPLKSAEFGPFSPLKILLYWSKSYIFQVKIWRKKFASKKKCCCCKTLILLYVRITNLLFYFFCILLFYNAREFFPCFKNVLFHIQYALSFCSSNIPTTLPWSLDQCWVWSIINPGHIYTHMELTLRSSKIQKNRLYGI